MINFTTLLRNGERVIRIVPFVKDLIPSNKDGLNSLIQSDSDEILKLNKKIKEQGKALYAKKQEIVVLKSKIELLQETIGGYQS
tara:strand:+ start:216 stop:467 length:252 start_codon:yes stop_codon:yes gene_type:complete